MPKNILMPSFAAGMEDGRLVRWLKRPGDAIAKGEALVEIETEKAVMEMEADDDGVLGAIVIADNTPAVPVNEVIGVLLNPGETLEDIAIPMAPTVLGSTAHAVPGEQVSVAATAPASAALDAPAVPAKRSVIASSPLARRLAETYRLDLGALKGSGPRGRVVRLDVENARKAGRAGAPAEETVPPQAKPGAAQTPLHHAWLRQGEGAPLVLVHGFGSDMNGWRPFLSGAPSTRPVLGIDLPGHGASRAHAERRFENIVEAVASTLDGLDLGRIDLVGHSLGGAVCVAVAAEGRVDVGSLFLIAPAGLGPDINGGFIEGFARARSEESLAPWLRELVADESLVGPALIRASLAGREDDGALAARQGVARALFPDGTQAISIRHSLARIAAPIAVVFGREDRIIPPRHGGGLPGQVGLHLFAGVGHMPHLEIREELWRLLGRHLRSAG